MNKEIHTYVSQVSFPSREEVERGKMPSIGIIMPDQEKEIEGKLELLVETTSAVEYMSPSVFEASEVEAFARRELQDNLIRHALKNSGTHLLFGKTRVLSAGLVTGIVAQSAKVYKLKEQ